MLFGTKEVKLKNGELCQITDLKEEYFNQILENFYSFFKEVDEDRNRLGPEVGILIPYYKPTQEEERKWFNDVLLGIEQDFKRVRVAVVSGKVVGMANIDKNRNVARTHVGTLGISIIKEYRNLGVGKALMEDILRISAGWVKIVVLEVFAENIRAYNLYKKFGFVEYGRLPDGVELRGKAFDVILMYKKLM